MDEILADGGGGDGDAGGSADLAVGAAGAAALTDARGAAVLDRVHVPVGVPGAYEVVATSAAPAARATISAVTLTTRVQTVAFADAAGWVPDWARADWDARAELRRLAGRVSHETARAVRAAFFGAGAPPPRLPG